MTGEIPLRVKPQTVKHGPGSRRHREKGSRAKRTARLLPTEAEQNSAGRLGDFAWYWLPVIASLIGITLFALAPQQLLYRFGFLAPFAHNDKAVHAVAFALFTAFLYRALRHATSRDQKRFWSMGFTFFASTSFGGVIELLQSQLPYRTADLDDLKANIAGILAVLLSIAITGWRRRTEPGEVEDREKVLKDLIRRRAAHASRSRNRNR